MTDDNHEKEASTMDATKKFWLGSAATGAGLASLAALIDLHRSAARGQKSLNKGPDDTLVLHLPTPEVVEEEHKREKRANMAFTRLGIGLGLTGVTYAVLHSLYNKARKKQLDGEIRDAATGYMSEFQTPERQHPKYANMNLLSLPALAGTLGDIPLYMALAGGIGSYSILNNTFPSAAKPDREAGRPKKIVVKGYGTVHADGPGNGPLGRRDSSNFTAEGKPLRSASPAGSPSELAEEEQPEERYDKAASIEMSVSPKDRIVALEFLANTLAAPATKQASVNNCVADLVGARDRDKQAFDQALEAGAVPVDLMRGGSDYFRALDEAGRFLAVKQAAHSPLVRPLLALFATAELNELHPGMAKCAAELAEDPLTEVRMSKAASIYHETMLAHICQGSQSKSAAALRDVWEKEQGTLDLSKPTDSHGDSSGEADDVFAGKEDPIDAFMLGRKSFEGSKLD